MDADKLVKEDGQKFAFLNGLNRFLLEKGKSLNKNPILAGKKIDLHDLYNRVTTFGGCAKVTKLELWGEILGEYGFKVVCSPLAYGLQSIYRSFLEDYERVHFFGEDNDTSLMRPPEIRRPNVSVYISDEYRVKNNFNMIRPRKSNYDRVVLSLLSCLPNEVDFAVNACTLLSGESRHVLKLPSCPTIIDALLLHAGIVSTESGSYKELLARFCVNTGHNLVKFWIDSISNKKTLKCLLPLVFEEKSIPKQPMEELVKSGLKTQDAPNSKRWTHLFQSNRLLGIEDYEGQRILQIALVLLNLSFEDFNVPLLAKHKCFIQFVFLCVSCKYSCLRQTGLDILSNMSGKIDFSILTPDLQKIMFAIIHEATLSQDKFELIRGFDVLGNICKTKSNADAVCLSTDDKVYAAAINYLTLTDVELLLAAIEALYRLSKLGEITCTKIVLIFNSIDILIYLLTLTVRSFGAESLQSIRLARRILPTANTEQTVQRVPSNPHIQSATFPRAATPIKQQPITQQSFPDRPQLVPQPPLQPFYARHVNPQMLPPNLQPTTSMPNQPPKITPQTTFILPTPQKQTQVIKPQLTHQPTPPITTTTVSTPLAKPQVKTSAPLSSNPPSSISIPSNPTLQPPTTVSTQEPPKTQPMTPKKEPVSNPPPPSTPEGVGATYTHTETNSSPPVFHYMPAPPTEIVLDSTAESFTKLWIWATYEECPGNYIPRVDVYAEYVASSNRYGRHTKQDVCSATDFGKCLKQVFPRANSRLFNQGRGHPQYHIADIKKRATPLPVPGHQLKDPVIITPPCSPARRKVSTVLSPKLNVDLRTGEIINSKSINATNINKNLSAKDLSHTNGSISKLPDAMTTQPIKQSSNNATIKTDYDTTNTLNDNNHLPVEILTKNLEDPEPNLTNGVLEDLIKDNSISEVGDENESSDKDCKKPAIIDALMKMNGIISPERENEKLLPEIKANGNDSLVNGIKEDCDITTINNMIIESRRKSKDNSSPEKHVFIKSDVTVNEKKNTKPVVNGNLLEDEKIKTYSNNNQNPLYNKSSNNSDCVVTKPEQTELINNNCIPTTTPNSSSEIVCSTSCQTANLSNLTITTTRIAGNIAASKPVQTGTKRHIVTTEPQQPPVKIIRMEANVPQATVVSNSLMNQISTSATVPQANISQTKLLSANIPQPQVPAAVPKTGNLPAQIIHTQQIPVNTSQIASAPMIQLGHQSAQSLPIIRPTLNPIAPKFVHPTVSTMTAKSTPQVKPQPTPYSIKPNPHFSVRPQALIQNPPKVHHRPPIPTPSQTRPQLSSKHPTIDLMAPNASLMVLLRNVGKIPFKNHLDEKEDAITKSIRLTAALILNNIAKHSHLGRSMLQRHEALFSNIAMSGSDCSPVLAKLLNEMNS